MDKKKWNKKTVLVSGIVLFGIWFLYFGGGTLTGLGIFRAFFWTTACRMKRRLTTINIVCRKSKKIFSNLAQMEVVNIKNCCKN